MDNIPIYINMCEKGVEVQEGKDRNPLIGDRVYKSGYEGTSIVVGLDEFYDDETWKVKLSDDFAYEDTRDLTWLPRQDQLQRMVGRTFDCYLISDFTEWLDNNNKCVSVSENVSRSPMFDWSMEQLWLAFVMKDKYNKTWNGKEWILQNQ